MRTTFTFHSAGQLLFGRGAVRQLGDEARRLGIKRVFIATDRVLDSAGIVAAVRKPLEAAGIALQVFDGGEPEPSLELADVMLEQARAFGPDGIIGLGGGSNMDLAKLAAAVLTHGGTTRDYIGEDRIPGPVLPLICIPTTAGTGSEVSASSVMTDKAAQLKVGILSNYLRPRVALVDPELTLSCPRKVTADSGIDVLTHAIEAYTAVDNADFPLPPGERSTYQGRHPFGDMFAEKAIALVGRHLARACEAPHDLEAREGMALAATLGGLAFSNVGVALVHALEYPVGGAVHCSHGAGNGLLLPYVMRYNLPLRRREFARVGQLLDGDTIGHLGPLSEGEETAAAEAAIVKIETLRTVIGIPHRLRELGAKPEQLRGFAEKAHNVKRIVRVNPRVPTVDDLEAILRAAY